MHKVEDICKIVENIGFVEYLNAAYVSTRNAPLEVASVASRTVRHHLGEYQKAIKGRNVKKNVSSNRFITVQWKKEENWHFKKLD